jgi:hypothetical protein
VAGGEATNPAAAGLLEVAAADAVAGMCLIGNDDGISSRTLEFIRVAGRGVPRKLPSPCRKRRKTSGEK